MAVIFGCSLLAVAQRRDAYVESRDHPAISYSTGSTSDAVSALNARLDNGSATLKYDESTGYLRSVLDALNVPVESQIMVFSQTSFQASLIRMHNPRAVFFNDTLSSMRSHRMPERSRPSSATTSASHVTCHGRRWAFPA